jgi:hypothetical protein
LHRTWDVTYENIFKLKNKFNSESLREDIEMRFI